MKFSPLRLYSSGSKEIRDAYFLKEGSVEFSISSVDEVKSRGQAVYPKLEDKYELKGKNLILGATEIILNHLLDDFKTVRLETALLLQDSKIKKIPVFKVLKGLRDQASFRENITMILEKKIFLTNHILNKKIEKLTSDNQKFVKGCFLYYQKLKELAKNNREKNLSALDQDNIFYNQGEIFYKSALSIEKTVKKNLWERMILLAQKYYDTIRGIRAVNDLIINKEKGKNLWPQLEEGLELLSN